MRVGRSDEWRQSAEGASHSTVTPKHKGGKRDMMKSSPPAGGSRQKLGCGVVNSDGGKATSLCRPHRNVAAPPKPFPAQKEEKKSLRRVHKSPPIASILRGGSPGGRQRLRRGDVEDGADPQEEAAEDGPKLWDQVELHHLTQVGVVAGGVGLKLDRRKHKVSRHHRQPWARQSPAEATLAELTAAAPSSSQHRLSANVNFC